MSDPAIVDSLREVKFYAGILKDVLYSAGSLFTWFILKWPTYFLFTGHLVIWLIALLYQYSDPNSVILATLAFFINTALAIYDAIITLTLTCMLSNCCVGGKAPFAFGIATCNLKSAVSYSPLIWFALAIGVLASLSGFSRSSTIAMLRKRTRIDVATATLYVGVKLYILTWSQIRWPFLFWVQTLATMGLVAGGTLFSYINKFMGYLVIGVAIALDIILLLGTYGVLGAPTFDATNGFSKLTVTRRHLLANASSYVFDPSPFVNPQHQFNLTLTVAGYKQLNTTVALANRFTLDMAFEEVEKLYSYVLGSMTDALHTMENAGAKYSAEVSSAVQNYAGSVASGTLTALSSASSAANAAGNTASAAVGYSGAAITELRTTIEGLTHACCTKQISDFISSSDAHTQVFQQEFSKVQTSVVTYVNSYPGLVAQDMKIITGAIKDFGNGVVGFINGPLASELSRWGKFVKWVLGGHHENWKYQPLDHINVGVPVPRLVNVVASASHALAILLSLSVLIAIYSRTAGSIINFAEYIPYANGKGRPDTGASTAVQMGLTEPLLRKRANGETEEGV